MIIVEGMDGSGKSGLVQRLSMQIHLPIHERASTSVGGPVSNLFEWAENDVNTWDTQPLSIYDRHPLVSEYVYGPITRGTVDPRFYSTMGRDASSIFSNNSLVVYCDPGWDEVKRNLDRDPKNQMPGVMDNSKRLYLAYKTFFHHYTGIKYLWDYTIDKDRGSYSRFVYLAESINLWKKEFNHAH